MGEFKTGKSSLINALLGEPILKSAVTPTTAIITLISYGATRRVLATFVDKTVREFSELDFHALTAEGDEGVALRKIIQTVEIFIDHPLLRNITLVDTPGLNVDNANHISITKKFVKNADAIVWVLGAARGASRTEVRAIRNLHIKPTIVVNRIDEIDDEEENLDDVLSDISKILGDADVVGVSALWAEAGRVIGDDRLIAESNLVALINKIMNTV
ncbi:dynamin family protein [Candidatus Epulonipiscium viviparus]|uniref:dynamin family protein n=1 Tax=Candidatus Epulonipiscium viviparus TaxID=420336 RepID=UPI0027380969|nr:dynamin family protein [Candidatus Epulopiscium viviparus]